MLAAFHQPFEDTRPFRLQLRGQLGIALFGGDRDAKGHEMKPALDRLVHAPQRGPVVPRDQEFERRREVEEIPAHESRRYRVAAGKLLDFRLCPLPPLLGLGRADEARAAQSRKIGRVFVATAGDKRLDGGPSCDSRKEFRRRLGKQNALAVCACSVGEEQRMLARRAGQRVSRNPSSQMTPIRPASPPVMRSKNSKNFGQSPLGATAVRLVT